MTIDVGAERPSLSAQVAEEIRVAMTRRRISGRQLAQVLGVSPSWISYRLSGVQPIDLNDLDRIATVLGVQVVDLLPPRVVRSGQRVTAQDVTRPPGHPHGRTRPTGPRRPVLLAA
jgi:transcriptional regulator with XRE-family HTH domain